MQTQSISDPAAAPASNRWALLRSAAWIRLLNALFIFLTSIVIVRSWIENVPSYMDLSLYLEGKERMPYQGRFLMMFPMRLAEKAAWVRRLCAHFPGKKLDDPKYMGIFLISVPVFLFTIYCIAWLYKSFSRNGALAWLVPWICIYAVQSTYIVRYEQSFMYPYDFPALAFFAAGLCLIRKRRFILFTAVFLLGTLNRETMLFLLPVLAAELYTGMRGGKNTGWKVVGSTLSISLLAALWFGIRVQIQHHFPCLRSEENSHFLNNLQFLRHLQDWPEMASTCGFLWLVPLLFWRRIENTRLRLYLVALLPPWVLVMFVYGMIAEARIFGELIVLLAPTAVILFEELSMRSERRAVVPR
jgi:hypothetical protein